MGENILNNKKILFLSASLFGYQHEITKAMERAGATVDYYDERPANSFIVKALIRINRNLISRYIDKYHNSIIDSCSDKSYDYIFITKGESISDVTLKKLKFAFPDAKMIIYHWDSIANNKNALNTLPYFDKILSFDKPDCQKLNLSFLPLFYLSDYVEVAQNEGKRDIDMLFVGTAHSDRYRLLTQIAQQFKALGRCVYQYIYFPSPILYYKMKMGDTALKNTNKSDFNYQSISKQEVLELYRRSNVIVDIQHPLQTGLTMRTVETLGAQRKLITTNQMIKEYDFYNPANILVVDRENPVVKAEFLEQPFVPTPKEIYEKYSIDTWIKTIFE